MVHFIFELLKISFLACVYATLTLIIFKIIQFFKPNNWFGRVSRNTFRFWFFSGLIISVVLFFFMFSYFGDHGLGDSATVPVGHFKVVRQTDGVSAYLQNDKGDQLRIKDFTYDDINLYAATEQEFNGEAGDYVIWNLKTDKWTFFKTSDDYLKFAKLNNSPYPNSFKDFGKFYSKYWNGWRFWILP